MKIIHRILRDLEQRRSLDDLKINELYLRSYFSVVRLSNGSIGSAGNFDIQFNYAGDVAYNPLQLEKGLCSKTYDDPLLLNSLWNMRKGVGRSLLVSIASALSQDLLTPEYLKKSSIRRQDIDEWDSFVHSILEKDDKVTVIGYGGVLSCLLDSGLPARINVSDLNFKYASFLQERKKDLKNKLRETRFKGNINLSEGSNNNELIHDSDVVFITGSALCNDTMTDLLVHSKDCRNVVIQGPSASLYPQVFFDSNVDHVLTNLKSEQEIEFGQYFGSKILDFVDNNRILLSRL